KGRIASPGMLLNKVPPMTGAAAPKRAGVVDAGRISMGARREVIGGGGAVAGSTNYFLAQNSCFGERARGLGTRRGPAGRAGREKSVDGSA
ncbi:MAG TPA: hypothetical protein VF852_12725, partial [Pseudolabrys sp.]